MYSRIVKNQFIRAGDVAIGAYLSGHALIQGNTLIQNGWGGWDWQWQAGGIKTVGATNLTLDSNTVFGTYGPALWCDIGCQGVVFSNNRIHDNNAPGILFEISNDAKIFGNYVWNTSGHPGIFISSSGNTEINDNLVYNSTWGIFLYLDNRPDQKPLVNNFVHDNNIVMAEDEIGLGFGDYGTNQSSDPASNNRGSNNAFWYPRAENGQIRYRYGGTFMASLNAFAATAGGTASRYLSDAEKDQLLTRGGIAP
jgi:parallel beta-helix repeat protein